MCILIRIGEHTTYRPVKENREDIPIMPPGLDKHSLSRTTLSRIYFHGSQGVRAIDVGLYM